MIGVRRCRAGVCVFLSLGWFALAARGTAQEQPPAPTASGTIAGKVLDASTGDPIIEAGVEVIQTGKRTRTDIDGKYTIAIAPGTYELRLFSGATRLVSSTLEVMAAN